MCYNQTNNSEINRHHEICLRLIHNDKKSFFEDLLEKDGFVSVHHKNLKTLAVEMFKVFFTEAFPLRQQSQYNRRNYSYFTMPRAKMVS